MTGSELLARAVAIMQETETEHYEPYAAPLINLVLAETFEVNQRIRRFGGNEELPALPQIRELSEEIPYEEVLCARALPLKLVIALSGLVFGFLISTFGKDIANPLGVQLSLLVVSVVSLFGLYCFYRYPEEKVLESLHFHEARLLQQQDSGKAAGSLDIDTAN